ncbi:transposase [Bradyrhizobium sp. 138]|nr:transposase [Bradyrhizobium sp. 138]
MDRFVLTDAQWAKMEPLCLGDPGRSGNNNQLFVEAVLWIARTGSPWRDLPRAFRNWITVYTRFRDWAKAGVWKRMFDAVSDEPDMEYVMVNATIVKVHRHGQAQKEDAKTGHRPLERRNDHQNPGTYRCARQSRAFRAAARTAL